ncbi:hypothetical protein DPMN_116657 [Dreissena polymorpha]|uniref:DUF6589 domain-containing protein n=1 Tax=Dreissena polymorpha TaxID=45954 RepID=A0A9D4QTR1_DREPO|nr:hypothetical protein DPMN_116657 [Dreissena polymorpha]
MKAFKTQKSLQKTVKAPKTNLGPESESESETVLDDEEKSNDDHHYSRPLNTVVADIQSNSVSVLMVIAAALTRFNRLGVTMSTTTKLRLLDEASSIMDKGIVSRLQKSPLVKITGGNLDMYIKTGQQSLEKSNRDLHLFASNIASPDKYSLVPTRTPLTDLNAEMFLLSGNYRSTLVNSYSVILGRILCELKAFSWMANVLPDHIHHPYQHEMSLKSDIFQLPIMMKNEAKHEDCVDILDTYEAVLSDYYHKAFGSSEDVLHKFGVTVGGDQLTRVRLEEAKNLRALATTPNKRFEDLHPFVIELWHTKQDFLEV